MSEAIPVQQQQQQQQRRSTKELQHRVVAVRGRWQIPFSTITAAEACYVTWFSLVYA